MDYTSLVTQKTIGLQQVMSSSASTIKVDEAEKLLDASNFKSWLSLLELNAGLLDGLLYEYVVHGNDAIIAVFPGIFEAAERDPDLRACVARMQNMLDRLIYWLITRSVSSSVLSDIRAFGQTDRSVLVMLQERYGHFDFSRMVNSMAGIVKTLPAEKAFTLCQSITENILEAKNAKEIGAILLLACGCPAEIRDKIVNIYSFGSDRSLDVSTVRELIHSHSSVTENETSGPSAGFVVKKKRSGVRCYGCGKMGHIIKDCLEGSRGDNRELKGKGKDINGKAWVAFNARNGSHSEYGIRFYFDSGANQHVVRDRSFFTTFEECEGTITGLGGDIAVEGQGTVIVKLNGSELKLLDCLYVPTAVTNLISIPRALGAGASFEMKGSRLKLDGSVVGTLDETMLFKAHVSVIKPFAMMSQSSSVSTGLADSELWHARFGHPSLGVFRAVNSAYGLNVRVSKVSPTLCETCARAKGSQVIPKQALHHATQPLMLLHVDLCGPFRYGEFNSNKYFLTIVDDWSKMVFVRPLQNKSDATEAIIEFVKSQERFFIGKGYKVGAIRTDNGGELVNNLFHEFCAETGIAHQLTVAHNSFQNGVVERFHRTIQERTRCLLIGGRVPVQLWSEAVSTAAYLINRLPSQSIRFEIPFVRWYGEEPGSMHLRTFGCAAFPLIPSVLRDGKLSDVSSLCVFVGYDKDHKAYRLFDPRTQHVIVSNQVRFDEKRFPFEEGTLIDPVVEKDFASGAIAGGVSGVPVVGADDRLRSRNVSKDIPTPPISEDDSELSDEPKYEPEDLHQDKINVEIPEDFHSKDSASSSTSVPPSGSDSEWSPSVVVSEKEIWKPVSGRRLVIWIFSLPRLYPYCRPSLLFLKRKLN